MVFEFSRSDKKSIIYFYLNTIPTNKPRVDPMP